ncbi:MAG: hypothetical protein KC877_02020 [Candidatus Kaiserbacteria bacterium]|nr:hypothetical protein [Candidatus Kaiserbacteria bacterium]MCB9816188.1 hypothetical protein [Candidatus Nomurabacteria bacterium]
MTPRRKFYRNVFLYGVYLTLAILLGYFMEPYVSTEWAEWIGFVGFASMACLFLIGLGLLPAELLRSTALRKVLYWTFGGVMFKAGYEFGVDPSDPDNIMMLFSGVGVYMMLIGYVLMGRQKFIKAGL